MSAFYLRLIHHVICLSQIQQKESKSGGVMSPDSPEPESDYNLTPRTEAKYNKIDEDFQIMIQRNQQMNSTHRSTLQTINYAIPSTVTLACNYSNTNLLQTSPQLSDNASPRAPSTDNESGKQDSTSISQT